MIKCATIRLRLATSHEKHSLGLKKWKQHVVQLLVKRLSLIVPTLKQVQKPGSGIPSPSVSIPFQIPAKLPILDN